MSTGPTGPTGPIGIGSIESSLLSYFFKKIAAQIVKTDTVLAPIPYYNESIPTSNIVGADNVWLDTDILNQGPAAASSIVTQRAIKMVSIHGRGNPPTIPLLAGIAWMSGCTGWVPSNYGIQYAPRFFIAPSNINTFDIQSPSFTPMAHNATNYFIFDQKSGVLTFLAPPNTSMLPYDLTSTVQSPSGSGNYTTTYSLWIYGYTYNGRILSTPTSNSGSGNTDSNLLRNIGINAYISGATGTSNYDQLSQTLTFPMTLVGNSLRYDVFFDLTSTGCTPTTLSYNTTYSTYTGNAGYTNQVSGIGQNGNFIINPSVILTNVNPCTSIPVPVSISTVNAGGTGTTGSGCQYALTIPVTISASDVMGNPSISNPASTYLSITAGATIYTVSGIKYYSSTATIVIPYWYLQLTNIYNIIYNPSLNYATFGGGVTDYSIAANSTTLVFGPSKVNYNPPGGNPVSGNSSPGVALGYTYYNNQQITLNVSGSGAVSLTVTNNKGLSTTTNSFFPASTTYSGFTTQSGIGYLDASIIETTIGSYSLSGVTSITRVSIKNSPSSALTPNTSSDIQAFSSTTLTNYDVQYIPIGESVGNVYTTNQLGTLASTYVLPSGSSSLSGGTKYLTFRINVTAPITTFALTLGTTAASHATISNMYVQWIDTAKGLTSTTWWNGLVAWDSTGCNNGTPLSANAKYFFKLNTAYINDYSTGSFIYVNIEFSGYMKLSEIFVSAS
jgi:hypothetical protein